MPFPLSDIFLSSRDESSYGCLAKEMWHWWCY